MKYLHFLLPSLLFISIIILIIQRRKMYPIPVWLLLAYLTINLLVESMGSWRKANLISNVSLYNGQMIFETVACLLLFFLASPARSFRQYIPLMIVGYFVFVILDAGWLEYRGGFWTNTYLTASILLSVTCLDYLFNFVVRQEGPSPVYDFMFWFSIGLLFSYLGNLPHLIIFNQMRVGSGGHLRNILIIISLTVNALFYLLISIGIICHRRTQT